MTQAFDPHGTYVHLPDGAAAEPVELTPEFWPELMAGQRDYPGRMLMAFRMAGGMAHWEMHPRGEEILYLQSGAVDLILDDGGKETTVRLTAGRATIVPRGVWHRFEFHEAGELIAITAGEGTETRPL